MPDASSSMNGRDHSPGRSHRHALPQPGGRYERRGPIVLPAGTFPTTFAAEVRTSTCRYVPDLAVADAGSPAVHGGGGACAPADAGPPAPTSTAPLRRLPRHRRGNAGLPPGRHGRRQLRPAAGRRCRPDVERGMARYHAGREYEQGAAHPRRPSRRDVRPGRPQLRLPDCRRPQAPARPSRSSATTTPARCRRRPTASSIRSPLASISSPPRRETTSKAASRLFDASDGRPRRSAGLLVWRSWATPGRAARIYAD